MMMQNNQLTGKLPSELGTLTHLTDVNFENNLLTVRDFVM